MGLISVLRAISLSTGCDMREVVLLPKFRCLATERIFLEMILGINPMEIMLLCLILCQVQLRGGETSNLGNSIYLELGLSTKGLSWKNSAHTPRIRTGLCKCCVSLQAWMSPWCWRAEQPFFSFPDWGFTSNSCTAIKALRGEPWSTPLVQSGS